MTILNAHNLTWLADSLWEHVFWKDLSYKKPGAKGKFVKLYLGPYKIIEVCSENMIVIQLPGGPNQVHINNISQARPEMIHAKLRYDGHRWFRVIQLTGDDVQNPCEVSQEVKNALVQEPDSAEVSVDITGEVLTSSQPSTSSEE